MSSTTTSSPMARALQLFDDQPLGVRAFVRARHLLCPLHVVEQQVPAAGRILDLGCGHGLFSALMAVASADRTILGVDPSPHKIEAALRLEKKLPNVRFVQGTIDSVREGELDGITIVDVLYLIPPAEKLRILCRSRELLRAGGSLVLKTNDTHPTWKYRWASLQEMAMTRLGLTMGGGTLHFFSCGQTLGLLRRAGFQNVRVMHLPTLLPYPHTLFSCVR